MKTLVVYYSRTGVTRTVAQALAASLQGDVEELVDTKDRSGALGWMGAGKDASFKHKAEIKPLAHDATTYDLVVIGTPVWAFTMTPAVRTFLAEFSERLRKVAFFCTMGGSGDQRTFKAMSAAAGTEPMATLALKEADVKGNKISEALAAFAARLTAGT